MPFCYAKRREYDKSERRNKWRKDWRDNNSDKVRAYLDRVRLSGARRATVYVYRMVKAGKLCNLKENIVICFNCYKERATVYDHRDYNKPREVTPVCRPCNYKLGAAIEYKKKGEGI